MYRERGDIIRRTYDDYFKSLKDEHPIMFEYFTNRYA